MLLKPVSVMLYVTFDRGAIGDENCFRARPFVLASRPPPLGRQAKNYVIYAKLKWDRYFPGPFSWNNLLLRLLSSPLSNRFLEKLQSFGFTAPASHWKSYSAVEPTRR